MKRLIALALLCLGPAFADAAEVVANPANRQPISEDQLKAMLIGKEKFWSSGSEVVIAILKSDADVEQTLARYSGMTASKFKNHWQRMAFSGRGKMPKVFNTAGELVAFVERTEGAIGIAPSSSDVGGLRVLELPVR